MNKLNVVWLCVTPIVSLNHIMKLKNVPQIMAPWITASIDAIKTREDIRLIVISVGPDWKKNYKFVYENVQYFFIRKFAPSFMKKFKANLRLDKFLNAIYLKHRVRNLVRKINPDIINLHGTEHEICSTFPGLTGNKILTIQGFINLVYKENKSPDIFKLLQTENIIFKTTKEFIIQADFMPAIISKYNAKAQFHFCQYPSIKPLIKATDYKPDSDLIFAARICKDKGVEDLIGAIEIIRETMPDIKLKLAGKVEKDYEQFVKDLIIEKGLNNNINFIGYVPSYEDLYLHIATSKIVVLPTHHDVIPSSVIESMFIGVPVISYCVGGLPDLNKKKQTCLLVKHGDIFELANAIVGLLSNKQKQDELVINAKQMVQENFDSSKTTQRLIEIYRTVLEGRK